MGTNQSKLKTWAVGLDHAQTMDSITVTARAATFEKAAMEAETNNPGYVAMRVRLQHPTKVV